MGGNLLIGQTSQKADLLTDIQLVTQIHVLLPLGTVPDNHHPEVRQILFQPDHAPQQEGHVFFMSQPGHRDQQGHLPAAVTLPYLPHRGRGRLITLLVQPCGQHPHIRLTVVSISILQIKSPFHALRGSDDGVAPPHKAAEIPGGQFLLDGPAALTADPAQQIVFFRSAAQPVDGACVIQVLLILGVVCIHQRNIVLLGQANRHLADEHRVMHMNHVKVLPGKCLLKHRIQRIGQHRVTVKVLAQGVVAHHVLLLFLSAPQIFIFGREHHHLMSLLPQSLRQTLDGDGHSTDIGLVIVGHHRYFHFYITFFPA